MGLTKKSGELAVARLRRVTYICSPPGERCVAGGDGTKLTRREASEWAQRNEM